MCGIAGRILREPGPVGADLVAMMQAMAHRGSDSTGFAMYGPTLPEGFVVRVVSMNRRRLDQDLETFHSILKDHGSDFLSDPTWDGLKQRHVSVRMTMAEPTSEFAEWLEEADAIGGFEIQSVGKTLEIIKDVGNAETVMEKHNLGSFIGTHGIANARMATESKVYPTASHPFWARPFPDIAIVHNGQLTNYWLTRYRLTRQGYRFYTDNDSEMIAVWISDQMSRGLTLEDALKLSLTEMDGVFTYLATTPYEMGMAKDRWAIKPLAEISENGNMATATEEQAVRKVYRRHHPVINYDGPAEYTTWACRPAEAIAA